VTLCFLGLMLMRVAERATNDTWRNLRRELARMHVGTFAGPAGSITQRTETTPRQREILRDLEIAEPPVVLELSTPRPHRAKSSAQALHATGTSRVAPSETPDQLTRSPTTVESGEEVPGIDPDPCAPMRSGSRRPLDESAVSLGHLVPLGDAIRPEPRPVCSGKDAARNDRASA
jgi:hypothetical protein